MPIYKGKRVTNAQYRELRMAAGTVTAAEAFGTNKTEAAEAEVEQQAPPKQKRARSQGKKQEIEDVLAEITGVDVNLDAVKEPENV